MRKRIKRPQERLLVPKSGGGKLAVALIHPRRYSVGMSSLGYQVVWRVLNDAPGVYVERAFGAPRPGKPPRTLESGRYVSDFDVVAFSLSYEPDAVNMCRFILDAGIPLEARKRHASHPLVIAGGIAPTLNPEPYADFVDLIVIGEAEEALPELAERLTESRGMSRTRLLAQAAAIPGVYAPRLYDVKYGKGIEILERTPKREGVPERVGRRWIRDIDRHPARSVFSAPDSEFGDMALLEISRGCGRGCRFCAAGHIMRPPRHRTLESLKGDIEALSGHFGCVGLVASSATDHPEINDLLGMIKSRGMSVSFASLPVEGLSELVLDAAAERSKTLTIAPETGTERLRRVVNKKATNEEIVDAVARAAAKGMKRIKLYFIVGLPTETDEDIAAMGELVRAAARAARKKARKNLETVASIAPFIPKPHTPFGLHPMENIKTIEARMAEVVGLVRKAPGATARTEPVPEATFQAVLSRGDRRAGSIIKRVLDEAGSFRRALRGLPKWALDTLYEGRAVDQPTPWSFIEDAIGETYLLEEYHHGLMGRLTKPCRPSKCQRCGACPQGELKGTNRA